MIRQDRISKMLIILAVAIVIYLATFETTTVVMFPFFLLVGGVAMEVFLERGHKPEVVSFSEEKSSLSQVAFYTVLALFGIFLTGYAVNLVPSLKMLSLTGVNAMLYGVLMGIAEEQFFRGFITDWFLANMGNVWVALLASAGVFTAYHFARYGTSANALAYVFFGGLILSWTAWKSRRVSPSMLAHAGNNFISYINVTAKVVQKLWR